MNAPAYTPLADFYDDLDVIQAASAKGEDIWDTAENFGRLLSKKRDGVQYVLGDLACLMEVHYGEDTLGKFASAIGETRRRLEDCRTVCKFFKKPTRVQIFETLPQLSFSHLRLAAQRFPTYEQAEAFLHECAQEGWTVEKASIALKKRMGAPVPPEKIDITARITHIAADGTLHLACIGGYAPVDVLHTGMTVRLRVSPHTTHTFKEVSHDE